MADMINVVVVSYRQSVIRVTFKDPKLQYMQNEQLEAWKSDGHPTEKLIDLGRLSLQAPLSLADTAKHLQINI